MTRILGVRLWLALVTVAALGWWSQAGKAQTAIKLRTPYQVTVGTTAAALTASGGVLGITLKCICPGQTVYLGVDNTVSTTTGWPMNDGDTFTVEVSDAGVIWAVATAAGQKLAVLPYRRN